jgi:hypothetical protein
LETTQALTWNDLVRLEPGLGQLHLDCRFADRRDPTGFDAELAWNGTAGEPGFKHRLEHLVGVKAENQDPLLVSPQAYELAVAECVRALPPNRAGHV